jgi:hypothetical protein
LSACTIGSFSRRAQLRLRANGTDFYSGDFDFTHSTEFFFAVILRKLLDYAALNDILHLLWELGCAIVNK